MNSYISFIKHRFSSIKNRRWVAVLLGLTIFLVAPLMLLCVVLIAMAATGSKGSVLVVPVAQWLGLEQAGLGGFLAVQLILLMGVVVLSAAGAALISWLLLRSRGLAALTFFSAVSAVIIVSVFTSWIRFQQLTPIQEAENAIKTYAAIGDISFQTEGSSVDRMAFQGEMIDLSVFRKLTIIVPVVVRHPGEYEVFLKYQDNGMCADQQKTVVRSLSEGTHLINVELINEPRRFGCFEDPSGVEGVADIQLAYLVPYKDLMNVLRAQNNPMFKRFEEDEQRAGKKDSDRLVGKFIQAKSISFGAVDL